MFNVFLRRFSKAENNLFHHILFKIAVKMNRNRLNQRNPTSQ